MKKAEAYWSNEWMIHLPVMVMMSMTIQWTWNSVAIPDVAAVAVVAVVGVVSFVPLHRRIRVYVKSLP